MEIGLEEYFSKNKSLQRTYKEASQIFNLGKYNKKDELVNPYTE